MATSNSLRRKRRMRPVKNTEVNKKEKTINTSGMNIGEKNKLAHELIKNGDASNLKEAWAIIKNG